MLRQFFVAQNYDKKVTKAIFRSVWAKFSGNWHGLCVVLVVINDFSRSKCV